MSDRDGLSEELAELERALIRSARLDVPVPSGARNRILATVGVVGSVVGSSGAAAGGASAGGSAWLAHSAGAAVVAKWLVAGAVVGGLSVGAVHMSKGPAELPSSKALLPAPSAEPARLEAPAREPGAAQAEPPVQAAGAERTPAEAPSGAERRHATSPPKGARPEIPPPAPAAGVLTPLSAEVAELDRARAALSAGNPERALGVLDAYRQKFPEGTLRPESAYVRIQAVLQRGDRAGARELASRFLTQYPNSPHAPHLRALAAP